MAKQQKMSQKQEWLRWVWLIWLTILGSWAYAQPGKDGAYTVTGNNTVVNRYTRVVADILAGTTTVVVQDITNLSLTGAGISYIVTSDSDDPNTFNSPDVPAMVQGGGYASNALSPGDLIMLYQAQGAIIDVSNTVNYGTILDYNNAGQYEFAYVSSVSGNVITLTCPAQNTYFAAQYVQVIRVPQYTTLTINAGASISAVPWGSHTFGGANASALDRRRGGVVAIHATNIVLNGSIEVDGDGFRGGTRDNFTSGAGATVYGDYVSTNPDISAEKGESIAGYRVDYGPSTGSIIDVGVVSVTGSGVAGRYGRGAPANGGGGGNAHNAGGGGGANGNNGNAWFRGTGVMSGLRGTNTCTAPAPWTLDPDYIDNGNALTNSSGGGRGGYTYGSANRNACTEGPGLAVWGGDYRDAVGGFGGRPLAYINNERYVFFGGGGGAGDGNNNANNDGGDGGGLIYLVVTNSITGSGIISANGQNGFNTISGHNDAPGGGGGGGTIVVKTKSIANTITFRANGGQGGDQLITNNESEGPGGGGGGGYIALSSANNGTPGVPATPTRLANGGDNGVTSSAAVTEFTMNGATKGASGQPNELISRYFIPYTTCKFPDNDGDGITDNNDIDDDNDGILDTTEGLNFDFSGDSNNNGIPDFLDPALGIWIDANVDGVNDLADRDNDGVPNHLDLDSDNDGIFDVREARANSDLRNVDANDDGRVDGPSNTNGFPDAVDNLETTSLPLAVPDTDGDGWRDFLDLDSDNDGINDVIEAFPSATAPPLPITVNDPDRNGIFGSGAVPPVNDSGFATGATGQNIPDKDGDGVPNFRDLDSDNDGINDVREANRPDTNNDGLADGGDADGDGIRDSVDGNNASFGEGINGDAFIPNTDATYEDAAARLFDFLDLDSDNDGINDVREGFSIDADPNNDGIVGPAGGTDTDGDGILNVIVASINIDGAPFVFGDANNFPPADTDSDGVFDFRDLDSDNDGINDIREYGPNGADLDVDGDGMVSTLNNDPDADGIINANITGFGLVDGNASGFGEGTNGDPVPVNTDRKQTSGPYSNSNYDDIPDYRDLDSDNDSVNDVIEYRDTNGNTIIDMGETNLDTNGDGMVDGADGTDFDGIVGLADGNNTTFGDVTDPTPVDTDGTGGPNYRDLDSDNNATFDIAGPGGVPASDLNSDGVVGNTNVVNDSDGDGIANAAGVDTRPFQFGDGLPDSDLDGVTDNIDIDDDNDGILDMFEGSGTESTEDADGDGIPNRLDLDADNDGITDVVEAGGIDSNGDGRVDFTEANADAADTDNDGLIDNIDTQVGTLNVFGNNVSELSAGTYNPTYSFYPVSGVINRDGDILPDFLDLDSDNDGISDVREAAGNDITLLDGRYDFIGSFAVNDLDRNGLLDNLQGASALITTTGASVGTPALQYLDNDGTANGNKVNADGDILPNFRDLDSDNDAINDTREATFNGLDPDGNGLIGTGTPVVDGTGRASGVVSQVLDTDGDGIADFLDLDSDNDGIYDLIEYLPVTLDIALNDPDANKDGVVGPATFTDADFDGIGDFTFGTFVIDGALATFGENVNGDPAPFNTDATSEGSTKIPDFRDLDSDNDGINDVREYFPNSVTDSDPNGDGIVGGVLVADTDGDGILEVTVSGVTIDGSTAFGDNTYTQPHNTDASTEGTIKIPDFRDLDSDNDGINDVRENNGTDLDNDGLADGTDADNDGIRSSTDNKSGFGDNADALPVNTDTNTEPTVKIPDYRDLDSDNDGINDVREGFPTEAGNTDADGNAIIGGAAFNTDADNDGIFDFVTTGSLVINVDGSAVFGDANDIRPTDTEGDGVADFRDLDSDNDGINDVREAYAFSPDPDGNGDGFIGSGSFADPDGDGILNVVLTGGINIDNAPTGYGDNTDPQPVNTDGAYANSRTDILPDYRDLDSDNDGINDVIENQDLNGNAVINGAEVNLDPDGNGMIDGPDTDGDGIRDVVDAALTVRGDAGDPTPTNPDNDTQPNFRDLNSDNTGGFDIADGGLGFTDLNADGIVGNVTTPNDPDFDGIANDTAIDTQPLLHGDGKLDFDNDGVTDDIDIDDDNDGIVDSLDGNIDTDGDGIVNRLDADSDNDGIPDVIEAGGIDANGDGIVDFAQANADLADADNDGLIDNIDTNPTLLSADNAASCKLSSGVYGGIYPANNVIDFDGDGVRDFLDIDSDNDGIFDVKEALGIDNNNDGRLDFTGTFASNDPDGNGWINSKDGKNGGVSPVISIGTLGNAPSAYTKGNNDKDIFPNFRDLDADNDGINDVIEATLLGLDTDANPNALVGTGIPVVDVNGAATGATTPTSATRDTDGDGVPDFLDLDSDNDGINDVREYYSPLQPGNPDPNGDGFVGDLTATDPDNDGILNVTIGTSFLIDRQPAVYGDAELATDAPWNTDFSKEGATKLPDYRDLDSDNDGINDVREAFPNSIDADPDNDGIVGAGAIDPDGDGILNAIVSGVNIDNNPTQLGDNLDPLAINTDGDVVPDYRDLDSDNDGISDVREFFPNSAGNPDPDGDGIVGNASTLDADLDGILDVTTSAGVQVDGNLGVFGDQLDGKPVNTDASLPIADNIPDYRDLDSDNDGINDVVEANPTNYATLDANNDGIVDGADTDNDGIRNAADAAPAIYGDNLDALPTDTDGDNIPNYRDLTSDGSTSDITGNLYSPTGPFNLPAVYRTPTDTDGDGQLDGNIDSDNDGIMDVADNAVPQFGEGADKDNDGVADAADIDDDNDGIVDAIEEDGLPGRDTDGDGIPNSQDLDSDNDGIADITEAGGVDANGDGIADFNELNADLADADNDGLIDNIDVNPSAVSPNAASSSELSNGSYGGIYPAANVIDRDNDGIPDFRDVDSDNDGIFDAVEAGILNVNVYGSGADIGEVLIFGTFISNDPDGNGWINSLDGGNGGTPKIITTGTPGSAPTAYVGGDKDSDGYPNFRDLDSDNDGINDAREAALTSTDTDGNAIIGTGTVNPANVTDRGLAIINGGGFTASITTNFYARDTDADGNPDFLDLDSDNDGINDVREYFPVTLGADPDPNGDGIVGNTGATDPDRDGILNVTLNTTLVDGNTTGFGENPSTDAAPNNADGDGVADFRDLDSDNDGINDVRENNGTDVDGDGLTDGSDTDQDGIRSSADTNPTAYGESSDAVPVNTDDSKEGDGSATEVKIPDYRDLDSDNDGINDVREGRSVLATFLANPDANNDGIIGDLSATDTDLDGILSVVDNYFQFGDSADPQPANTDTDNIPDYRDLDSDNDGINDVRENLPSTIGVGNPDADGNGIAGDNTGGVYTDADNDGILDLTTSGGTTFDKNTSTFGEVTGDEVPHDQDDDVNIAEITPDYRDLDSDNDGINDVIERNPTIAANLLDADNNGYVDGNIDADNDGIRDNADTDGGTGFGENGTPDAVPYEDGGDSDILPNFRDLISYSDVNTPATRDITTTSGPYSTMPAIYRAPGTDPDGNGIVGDQTLPPSAADRNDFDNDGILNVADNLPAVLGEGSDTDSDGDGVLDVVDIDDDNDGIVDDREDRGVVDQDTDGDGIPNRLDLDSDNDGIADVVEAGGIDANNDGRADFSQANANLADSDDDGLIDNLDIASAISPNAPGSSRLTNGSLGGIYPTTDAINRDNDALPDFLDVDSDNDGIYDAAEVREPAANIIPRTTAGTGGRLNYNISLDPDKNGWVNSRDGSQGGTPLSTTAGTVTTGFHNAPAPTYTSGDIDSDGLPNFRDLDADNDGVNDVREATIATDGLDLNTFGGTTDDGLMGTTLASVEANGAFSSVIRNPVDTDSDGLPDLLDLDADNDGINDVREYRAFNESSYDADGDGYVDGAGDDDLDGIRNLADGNTGTDVITKYGDTGDPAPSNFDSDTFGGEPVRDFRDLDSDNDGIYDLREGTTLNYTDANNDGRIDGADTDGDGIKNEADANPTVRGDLNDPVPTNTDGTAEPATKLPDFRDLDSDNDGINDVIEATLAGLDGTSANGLAGNQAAAALTTITIDGFVSGFVTNSPRNSDNDNVPDYRDLDNDNDAINDIREASNAANNMVASDTNNNGVFDNADTGYADGDNDGIANFGTVDGAAGTYGDNNNPAPPNTDGDTNGVADFRDLDSDNDGINDVREYFPVSTANPDSNNDGFVGGASDTDTDGDGIINVTIGAINVDNQASAGFGEATGDNVPQNTDGVDQPDFRDLDADNDGIYDLRENLLSSSTIPNNDTNNNGRIDSGETGGTDTDNDGIATSFDGNTSAQGETGDIPPVNTDGDTSPIIPDFRDIDSDNDGIPDVIEARANSFPVAALPAHDPIDANYDGRADDTNDTNLDGVVNALQTPIQTAPNDHDGDLQPDFRDLDSDNDFSTDTNEGFDDNQNDVGGLKEDLLARATLFADLTKYNNAIDLNANGRADWLDDTDGDDLVNFLDPDSPFYFDTDNDGLVDLFDVGFVNARGYAQITTGLTNPDTRNPDNNSNNLANYRDITTTSSLPLTLLSFEAKAVGNSAVLTWRTTNEKNTSHFEIERSEDALNFVKIGVLDAKGTSPLQINTYQFIDTQVLLGWNYYRFKQVDLDGKFEYSPIRAVNFNNLPQIVFDLYPNPAQEQLQIRFTETEAQDLNIQIFDVQGKLQGVHKFTSQVGENLIELNIRYLAQGQYQILLVKDGQVKVLRFIKQ